MASYLLKNSLFRLILCLNYKLSPPEIWLDPFPATDNGQDLSRMFSYVRFNQERHDIFEKCYVEII